MVAEVVSASMVSSIDHDPDVPSSPRIRPSGSGDPSTRRPGLVRAPPTSIDDLKFGQDEAPDLTGIVRLFSREKSFRTASETLDKSKEDGTGVVVSTSTLDPQDPSFDFVTWLRVFFEQLEQRDIRPRRSGFTFKDLTVSGTGAAFRTQQDVGSTLMAPLRIPKLFAQRNPAPKQILHSFNGTVDGGEMLIVLGRPGSGCTTFLKSISGLWQGLSRSEESSICYDGIGQDIFLKAFKGKVVYSPDSDQHFPHLTVAQTLVFAAAARTRTPVFNDISNKDFPKYMVQVVMSLLGLSHVNNTKVGSDFVRGVSGGERKRVTIAETSLSGSQIVSWDNSTRGLDAATAIDFVRALRITSDIAGMTHAVAIYQASQAIYDMFDKVIVLYEGRQVYFGPARSARSYFEDMGWLCPSRQTTGDFLTSITNPNERRAIPGLEKKVPRTAEEFEQHWLRSREHSHYVKQLAQKEQKRQSSQHTTIKPDEKASSTKQKRDAGLDGPYAVGIPKQIAICTIRAYQRLWNDKATTISVIFAQIAQALIIGSIFYRTEDSTASFFARGSVLYFAIITNALLSIGEIGGLYEQRPIVERQASYAFYHPFAEAIAGIVADLPVKFIISTVFNLILYFLAGLRREASSFFLFLLFNFISILLMSAIFRTLAAATKTVSQALSFAGVAVLAIIIYTGFTLQRSYMHPWFKWISWLNPLAYSYEALLVNEVHGRQFPCAPTSVIPPYGTGEDFQCAVIGAKAGEMLIPGDSWVNASYGYSYSHIWRNLGFLFIYMCFFYVLYIVTTEFNSKPLSVAESLVFRCGHLPKVRDSGTGDLEAPGQADPEDGVSAVGQTVNRRQVVPRIRGQNKTLTWRNVSLEISIRGERRLLLDEVSGWVNPGTLTALMGVSGAGKTTLLDTLSQRMSVGVLTGDMLIDGKPLNSAFQRKIGYVQQQDLHLETSTVREALRFSAILRRPKEIPLSEKYEFVEEVIVMLGMEDFSEAVVGSPGDGLNVEQRKLLTIGVELAAKPALLLFLDEPTSGLDSQSSWSIVAVLRKLADNGQAILSTIHQPSAILFQEFDRLLFLAKGGKTVYFGDIGQESRTLLDYFERAGARRCGDEENPAEYILETVGAGTQGKRVQNWPEIWKSSSEIRAVEAELDRLNATLSDTQQVDGSSTGEFAMPLTSQFYWVAVRVFQQYWRSPGYILAKYSLCIFSALFIGFSFFRQNDSVTGMQNTLFAVFMLTILFSVLVQQIMPQFVTQRSLYEIRERPSKAYSWIVFLTANILVEIPYQLFASVLLFVCWYYPVFGSHQSGQTQGLMLLLCAQFLVFASTFAHLVVCIAPDAETAGNVATLLFSLSLIFNGIMQPPSALPGFWTFMWRVSPLTYMIGAWTGTGLGGRQITCSVVELAVFNPPAGQTCGAYLAPYFREGAIGQLYNPDASQGCQYCQLSNADQFLATVDIFTTQRWRDYGLGFVYIAFNIGGTIGLYYLFRVKRWSLASLVRRPVTMVNAVTSRKAA